MGLSVVTQLNYIPQMFNNQSSAIDAKLEPYELLIFLNKDPLKLGKTNSETYFVIFRNQSLELVEFNPYLKCLESLSIIDLLDWNNMDHQIMMFKLEHPWKFGLLVADFRLQNLTFFECFLAVSENLNPEKLKKNEIQYESETQNPKDGGSKGNELGIIQKWTIEVSFEQLTKLNVEYFAVRKGQDIVLTKYGGFDLKNGEMVIDYKYSEKTIRKLIAGKNKNSLQSVEDDNQGNSIYQEFKLSENIFCQQCPLTNRLLDYEDNINSKGKKLNKSPISCLIQEAKIDKIENTVQQSQITQSDMKEELGPLSTNRNFCQSPKIQRMHNKAPTFKNFELRIHPLDKSRNLSFLYFDQKQNIIKIINKNGFIVQTLQIKDPNTNIQKIHSYEMGMFLGHGGTGSGFNFKFFHYSTLNLKLEVDMSSGIQYLVDSVKKNRMDIRIFVDKLLQYREILPSLIDKYELLKLVLVLGKVDFLRDNYHQFEDVCFKFRYYGKIEGWRHDIVAEVHSLEHSNCELI